MREAVQKRESKLLEIKERKSVELSNEPLIIILYRRRVEQLEARRAHNPKVAGSSPASAIYSYPGKGAWDCEKRSREMSEWCKLTRSSWGLARSPGEDACQWLYCSKSC